MPYSSIGAVPQALRTAGLTLSQVNIWARYFDQAKRTGAESPGAIAWIRFKYRYRKVGGKWVRKVSKEVVEGIEGEPVVIDKRGFEDYEYLLHHMHIDEEGNEEIHHCLIYDHIANMFVQEHLTIKDGKAYLGDTQVEEGVFHVIKGLEPTQEVAWSDNEAKDNEVRPKEMKAGMKLKEKSKMW